MTKQSALNTWIVLATPKNLPAHEYCAPGRVHRVFDTSDIALVPVAFEGKRGANEFTLKNPPAGQVWAEVDALSIA